MCGVVASSNQHNLVGLGKRCRHLRCNLRKSLKHKRENGGISVLLVGARLHPHPLGLGPANCLSCSCLSSTDQADLLTISAGSLTVAITSFSFLLISCSSISICFLLSTTWICSSSCLILCWILAA